MRKHPAPLLLLLAITAGCNEEVLTSTSGVIQLDACDAACGACAEVTPDLSLLEFGPALAGEQLTQRLQIRNTNQPFDLTIEFALDDPSKRFALASIDVFESEEATTSTPFSSSQGRLKLDGTAWAEVTLTYNAEDSAETVSTLMVASDSRENSSWEVTLRAGPVTLDTPVRANGAACDLTITGQPNCTVEFGSFSSDDITYDKDGSAELLSSAEITITNNSDDTLYVGAELTADGIPELNPEEKVGTNGVFFITPLACEALAPGANLSLAVEFKPRESGEFTGEVLLRGLGRLVAVELKARVVGPALCAEAHPVEALVDVEAAAPCPETPAVAGDVNCVLDFGEHSDADIGLDPVANLPKILGTKSIVVTNTSDAELFLSGELTDDGIPEGPGELVGEFGVFFASPVQCELVPPGGSYVLQVDFRPAQSGTFQGRVHLNGMTGTMNVGLLGKVTGPALCIRTEDNHPNDADLVFHNIVGKGTTSDPKRIFLSNCGYQAALTITNVTRGQAWNDGFRSSLNLDPWVVPAPIPVGGEIELPFTFFANPDPAGPLGPASAILNITTNATRPNAIARLHATVGPAPVCILAAAPTSLDFGWVASDEAGVGFPGSNQISRSRSVILANIGQAPCTDVHVDTIIPDPNSTGMFTVRANPNGASFTLQPGANSLPIDLLFSRTGGPQAQNHSALLPFRAAETTFSVAAPCPAGYNCVNLTAKGGGNPYCEIDFSPVSPANLFCPYETVAFGNVNIGTTRTIDLKLRNVGSDECLVTSIAKTGSTNAFGYIAPSYPASILPGASITVPVTFTPLPPNPNNPFDDLPFGCGFAGLGLGGETLVFNYHSAISPGVTESTQLSLSGNGTQPDIDVIPGDVNFGEVTVGCCSAPVRVAIYNSGDGVLDISSVGILASSDPGFEVVTPPGSMQLNPGGSTELEVRWCANAEGTASGVLEIVSSDDNDEYFTVSLAGTGTLDNQGLDDYAQPDRPKVDVLWVVDDSGSMGDEQQILANNFNNFINTAVSLNTDYHIGVINTDVQSEESGKLYACQGPLWIDDTMPAATQQSYFQCNVQTLNWPRPHSDAQEGGLGAARKALEYPNIDGHNAGFYREDAKLYVIIVTDEEDQSNGTAQQYVDWFRNLKGLGNPDLLNISAIAGPPPNGCATASGNKVDYDAAQMTGGQFLSICTADWSGMINQLGLDVFTARQQFPLSRPATGNTIVVTVCDPGPTNCVTVPEDPNNGWTFDSTLNSITFHGTSVPGPSQEIQVDYLAVCYQ